MMLASSHCSIESYGSRGPATVSILMWLWEQARSRSPASFAVTPHEFEPGCVLRTCSADDLIVHKAIAGRTQDILDIKGVVNRQIGKLDRAYLFAAG